MNSFRCIRDFHEPLTNFKVKRGDSLKVKETGQNWWKVKNKKTGKKGMVPKNILIKDGNNFEFYEGFCNFTRKEAELKLMLPCVKSGTFLIRPCSDRNKMVLSFKYETSENMYEVAHYMISKNNLNKIYITDDLAFSKIHDLIHHYSVHQKLRGPLKEIYSTYFSIPPLNELEIPREQIFLKTTIGKGFFGEVFFGLLGKTIEIAVKIVENADMETSEFYNEAEIIHKLQHPHILQLIGICTKPESQPMYLITEYMHLGTVKKFLLKSSSKGITIDHLIQLIYQIAQGMQYLISKGILHRDLRADNVLVANDMTIRIADFGLARLTQNNIYVATGKVNYPMRWAAPELIISGNTFTEKTDVWSYGITCYEIFSRGGLPYFGETSEQVMDKVKSGYILPLPSDFECPKDIRDIILSCWKYRDCERPSFKVLVDKLKQRFNDPGH